jgi:hypothetical protein
MVKNIHIKSDDDNVMILHGFSFGTASGSDGRTGIVASLILENHPNPVMLIFPSHTCTDFAQQFLDTLLAASGNRPANGN